MEILADIDALLEAEGLWEADILLDIEAEGLAEIEADILLDILALGLWEADILLEILLEIEAEMLALGD